MRHRAKAAGVTHGRLPVTRRWRRLAGFALLLPVAGLLPAAAQSGPDGADTHLGSADTGLWIVQLDEPSLATYAGDLSGLRATSPQVTGAERLDVDKRASREYLAHLDQRQDRFTAVAGRSLGRSVDVERSLRNVLNAVVVRASAAEAAELAALPQVKAVWPDGVRELDTDVSNEVIGSPAVWAGATGGGVGSRGEGVLVGVIDTGINPEHPSFAATDGDGYTHTNPFGSGNYVGVCDPDSAQFDPSFGCNDKLIGAWHFDPRVLSARDAKGHGSHTASTAAGNAHDATVTMGGSEIVRRVSGVAPRANIISYLVCAPDCFESSLLAAVDQAVADGVDVINYSISGQDDPWADPVDLAFLEAAGAGVFIAASAGNAGPGAGTVAKTGPWNASVAASTTNRVFAQTLDVTEPADPPPGLTGMVAVPGDGPAVTGGLEGPVRDAGLVDEDNARGCASYPLGAFDGTIAVIERGECPFATKVNIAVGAGAVGVVVVNNTGGPPIVMGGLATAAQVPAVMVDQPSGQALRDFIATQGEVRVRVNPGTQVLVDEAWGNVMAGFSSRGPSQFDLLAPTFTTPGVNILAASAGSADAYAVLQGTSMAAPHASGAGALLTSLHPGWSPSQVRSALALTANPDVLASHDGGPAGVFDQGAGLLDVDAAARSGLVLDEEYDDFVAANPAAGGDPKTLNLPAMVDQNCSVTCSWTRTLTSVADVEATWTASVDSPGGLGVVVEPASFTLAPGATAEVTVTATSTDIPAGQWAHATVEFDTDASHAAGGVPVSSARFPVAVVPAPAHAGIDPGHIDAQQGAGEQSEHTVSISNTGGQDLTWTVLDGEGPDHGLTLRPGDATAVTATEPSAAPPATDAAPAVGRNPHHPADTGDDTAAGSAAGPGAVVEDLPDGEVRITHSASQDIVPGNSIACAAQRTTADNGYLRTFTLEDFAVFNDFEVTEVSFGVEAVNFAPITATVNLYTLDQEPLVYANLTEIGSAQVTLDPQGAGLVTVPVDGTVPAGSTLVAEIDSPDMAFAAGLFIGSNSAGQSAPSYWRSATCGEPEPVDLAAAGFGGMHVVMGVTGTTDAPDTQLPDWVEVTPASGTVAPGEQDEVTLTLDSTGLDAGTYQGAMFVETNDPDRSHTVIPLTLTIDDTNDPAPSEGSQDIIATIPDMPGDGSLVLSVDPDDRTVTLPELANGGDRLATSGGLRPVTVTDTRAAANPGWDASAQVSDFAGDAGSFGGGYLGWTPSVASQSSGQIVTPGGAVAPGFPTGHGLSIPRTLATAGTGSGVGTAVLGAGLDLQIPTTTTPGVYTAVLTLTAI